MPFDLTDNRQTVDHILPAAGSHRTGIKHAARTVFAFYSRVFAGIFVFADNAVVFHHTISSGIIVPKEERKIQRSRTTHTKPSISIANFAKFFKKKDIFPKIYL